MKDHWMEPITPAFRELPRGWPVKDSSSNAGADDAESQRLHISLQNLALVNRPGDRAERIADRQRAFVLLRAARRRSLLTDFWQARP